MKQMKRYKRLIKFGMAAMVLFAEIGPYYPLWTHYYNRAITMPFWRRGNWFITGLCGTVLFVFHNLYDGLKVGFFRKNNIIYSQFLAILATNVFGYLLLALVERHQYVPLPFVILTAADMALVFFWASTFQWTYNLLSPSRQLLLIYGKRSVAHMLERMNLRDNKYMLTAAIRTDEGMERIMQEVSKYDGIVIDDLGSHDRDLIFKRYYEMGKHVYTVPEISDVLTRSSNELKLFDTVLLLSRSDGLQVDQLFCKHALDILSAGALLILSLPLFLPSAIVVRLEGRGPAFYRQCRLTKDGKALNILKFRTMRVNARADGAARLAAQANGQITRVGKVLRVTRLDELPRVLNIPKGDMSVTGPRPERPEITAGYKKEIPEFDYRLKVKADLMGYAQIYGIYNTTPYGKLKFDPIYIRNYSTFFDLKPILMTLKILLVEEKAKGVANGQVTAVQQTGGLSDELKF